MSAPIRTLRGFADGKVAAAGTWQRRSLAFSWVVAALALACAGAAPRVGVPENGGMVVASDAALGLERRAEGFYLRIAHRRFNTLETFNDFIMRDYFQSPDLFFDYYADLAQAFTEANFERSRPTKARVLEFAFEDERTVRVQVRFDGFDGRPLRPGSTHLVRVDRWELAEGTWWIRPGKL